MVMFYLFKKKFMVMVYLFKKKFHTHNERKKKSNEKTSKRKIDRNLIYYKLEFFCLILMPLYHEVSLSFLS